MDYSTLDLYDLIIVREAQKILQDRENIKNRDDQGGKSND